MTTAFQSGAFQEDAYQIDAAAVGYSITCDPGSYAITGSSATISRNRALTANAGSYAYTGTAATLVKGRGLTASSGAYAYTGSSADITKATPGAYTITALAGEYVISGQPATITYASGTVADTHDGVPSWYLKWWLNQHKKKNIETVEEALEIVQETVLQAPPKVAKRPEVIAARDDLQLQLFIARQIVLARQEIKRLEDEEEEELILAMLL
jgi:hypothetical protein